LSILSPSGCRGVINAEADGNELRLSSIEDKDDRPVCFVSYNQNGYSSHCRKYAEYQDWVRNRNPIRYESNLDKNYDSKNMMHCFRLMEQSTIREKIDVGLVNDLMIEIRKRQLALG